MLVHLGAAAPAWLPDALRQARCFNKCPVFLISAAQMLAETELPPGVIPLAMEAIGLSAKHRAFEQLAGWDGFRQGFWRFTTERFFAIETAMIHLELERAFHIENDVMLYADLESLAPRFERLYSGIAATFDNDRRCIPGFMYFRDVKAIGELTSFILAMLQELSKKSLSPDDWASWNDMALVAAFRARFPTRIKALPIVPPDYPGPLSSLAGDVPFNAAEYWRHFEVLGHVFDAAALGQYLDGVDPRNDPKSGGGFINESCIFNPGALKPRLIADSDGRRIPVVETASGLHRVANLHIHSKRLGRFLSVGGRETP